MADTEVYAIPMPDPRWGSFHITHPSSDVTLYANDRGMSAEMAAGIADLTDTLVERRQWVLRTAG